MADLHGDKGLLFSILDEIARPGEMLRALLAGKGEGAARQLGQGLLNNIDALLPGDWLPNDVAREEDYTSGRELLDSYGLDPGDGFLGGAAGLATEVLTDPTMLIPGAAIAKGASTAARLAGKGAAKIVGQEALDATGRHVRSTFGHSRLSSPIKEAVSRARAVSSGVSQAGIKALDELLKGTSTEQQDLLGEILHNLKREGGKVTGSIDQTGLSVRDRALSHLAGRDDAAQLAELSERLSEYSQRQFRTGRDKLSIFDDGVGADDYFPRQFSGVKSDDVVEDAFGRPSAVKGRTLNTPDEVAKFMAENPDVGLEFNAQRALASRAQQQGALAGKASIGKSLTDDSFRYADDASRTKAAEAIKALPAEEREVVEAIYKGLPPRGFVTSVLNKTNRLWKPMVTGGWLLPSLAFNVRNRISGIFQTATTESAQAGTLGMAKRTVSDIGGAVAEGMGLQAPDKVGKILSAWDESLKASGGDYHAALEAMKSAGHGQAAELIEHGVIEGFISSEEMISAAKAGGLLGKIQRAGEWPSKIVQGLEQRMRLGLGLDLLASKGAKGAADAVKESMFDYAVSTGKNRAFRDAISFGHYPSQAIVQQARFLGKNPKALSVMANAMSSNGDDELTYPWMDGKANISLGDGQFVTSLGLPVESFGMIPNFSASLNEFGDQVERNIVGATNPLLKTAYSVVAGHDPVFESVTGSYGKLPVIGEAGAVGRAANLAFGAGLGQQVISPLRTIENFTDDRKDIGLRLLDALSGVNVVDVDQDRAITQRLTQGLANDPSVLQIRTPINGSGDPDTQAMIDDLREARKRQKAARMAEVAKGDVL